MNLVSQAHALQPHIVQVRREIHQIAEVGLNTFQTASVILRELKAIGIPEEDIRVMVNGAAVAAVIHGATPGKCLGIRVDSDALPIREETDEPFKSTNGNMHACGHDTHVAMGIGAAKLIYDNREHLIGDVKMIFQPGEETASGAKAMIEEGVLENPRVDALISLHCRVLDKRLPEFPCGSLAATTGFSSSACTLAFRTVFKGKGAHGGSSPHLSVDPIFMGAAAIMQLQSIVSRERNPIEPAVLSVCHIEAGTKDNIIPEELFFEGTIRTLSLEYAKHIFHRVETICSSVAESMGGSSTTTMEHCLPDTKTDAALLKVFRRSAEKVVGKDRVYTLTQPAMGGEDLGYFSELIPTLRFRHSQRYDDGREQYSTHNPKFTSCEDGYWSGSACLAQCAFDWQKEESEMESRT